MRWVLAPVLSLQLLHAQPNASQQALARATLRGDVHTMENLLTLGVDPNFRNSDGMTLVGMALRLSGSSAAAAMLVSHHADPNAPIGRQSNASQGPVTPLQQAAQAGDLGLASELIANGADLDSKNAPERRPLHFAVAGSHLDMVRLLIEKGADVNARDAEGASPLDDAAWNGALDCAAILLAHGARLNEPDAGTGATPVNEAAFVGNTQVVRYLLEFRPDVGIADKRGFVPLENAIRMRKEESAVVLLEAEPKELETPRFLASAMEIAAQKNEPAVVRALIDHGVAANAVLPSGTTPLDAAAFAGSTQAVQALLDNGADPNGISRNETTPLEDAALKGLAPIVIALLDHGAAVNYVNSGSGGTALYAAASFGKSDLVELLLSRGADPNLCGTNRRSPYRAAIENGFTAVAAQIERRGGGETCRDGK